MPALLRSYLWPSLFERNTSQMDGTVLPTREDFPSLSFTEAPECGGTVIAVLHLVLPKCGTISKLGSSFSLAEPEENLLGF